MATKKTSKGAIPKTSKGSISKPAPKPIVSANKEAKAKSAKAKDTEKKKETVAWQLPSFAMPPPKKKEINWEKLRKETARRHSPEGEDIKEIRRILKEIKKVDVPVHEFINMVSPYTSDNGAVLRTIMAEDLETFHKLAKKVYETMTQDVSDVLINEQLQMVQFYDEKTSALSDKMMCAINEIYEMAPKFEFDKYLRDKDDYLQSLFPMPKESEYLSDETAEMMKRQQAYHRLQWLRSEGGRMAEENRRLQKRLEELKREQQEEQNRAAERAAEAETKRQELAVEENEMKEKLEKLNVSIEKSFIREEMDITKEHNKEATEASSTLQLGPKASTGAVRKTRSGASMKKGKKKKPEWSSKTAMDIEEDAMMGAVASEASRAPSRSAMRRPKKSKEPRSTSPFHFSPPKTPSEERQPPSSTRVEEEQDTFASFGRTRPKKAARPPSPFHYSPPKTPPEERQPPSSARGEEEQDTFASFGRARPKKAAKPPSPFHFSPPKTPPQPQVMETRIEEVTTTVQQKRPQPRARQSMAPRDSWGGFY